MRNLSFSSNLKIANHNRSYRTLAPVTNGNFLSLMDLRSTPEVIAVHTYSGVYYGVFYGDISSLSNGEYYIHYKSEGRTATNWCIGVRVRVSSNILVLEFIEGLWQTTGLPSASYSFSTASLVKPSGWCKIAWYFTAKPGLENTSCFWINNVEMPLSNHKTGPATSKLLNTSFIMSPGTPAEYKMGTLWAGFDYATEKADFEAIMARWTGKIPYFMGRFGEHPLGGTAATTYINCSEESVRDRPIEAYYITTGTVDLAYDYVPFQVAAITD